MPDVVFRLVDLETLGLLEEQPQEIRDDPCRGICELGWTDVFVRVKENNSIGAVHIADNHASLLCNPPGGVPPESQAIHHLTPKMLAGHPACDGSAIRALATSPTSLGAPFALVAANADFERSWMGKYLAPDTRWICTVKVAAQLYPDWPTHSNQGARYLLGLELDERADPPHRAGPDSWVTANVLSAFLKQATVRQMLQWTREPRLLTRCPLGEHRNKPWADVPEDFLRWACGPKPDRMDPDVKYWAQQELEKRARLRADPDLASSGY